MLLPTQTRWQQGDGGQLGQSVAVSQCSATVNDFHCAVSRHHINHIRITHMPDCHMQSDSSTFHTVNPGDKKIERQKDKEMGCAERKRKEYVERKDAKMLR